MAQETFKLVLLPIPTETQWERDALSLTIQARLHQGEAMQAHLQMQEDLTCYWIARAQRADKRLKTMQWVAIVGWLIVLVINAVWLADWLANWVMNK